MDKKSKKELKRIIDKYKEIRKKGERIRELQRKLVNKTISKSELKELIELRKELKTLPQKEKKIFANLKAFIEFYDKNIDWYESNIRDAKDKFTKFLFKKLKKLEGALTKEDQKEKIEEIDEELIEVLISKLEQPEDGWEGYTPLPEEARKHPTVKLLYHLMKKMEVHPDIVKAFKHKHTYAYLSRLLEKHNDYVGEINRGRKNNFTHEDLRNLIKNLKSKFGTLAKELVEIVKRFIPLADSANLQQNKAFIDKTLKGLDKIHIELNLSRFGIILCGHKHAISNYLKHFRKTESTIKNRSYNPDFYLDLETLEDFDEQLKTLMGVEATESLKLINAYRTQFKDKIRVGLRHNVGNKEYFDDLDKVDVESISNEEFDQILEKFYWFGYLLADGWAYDIPERGDYRVGFKQKKLDGKMVDRFSNAVDYKGEVRNIDVSWLYKGKLKSSRQRLVRFGCLHMVETLKKLEFLDFKADKIGLPKFIKKYIQDAKKESKSKNVKKWGSTKKGKMALTFLSGFYDGDGSYDQKGNSAKIFNSNKKFIDEIKNLFGLPGKIYVDPIERLNKEDLEAFEPSDYARITRKKPRYSLVIGSKTFKKMINVYPGGLKRKRPKE